jgi:D-arabinose 5-phosphate isomerase GutQ
LTVIFSASGESDEILRLLSIVKKLDHPVIAITSVSFAWSADSTSAMICVS